jgi:ribosome-binding factor A
MSLRTERAAELIRREIAPILERDYVFKNMVITVQAVDLDPDLKSGRVWVSILGGKDYDHTEVIEKLRANRAHIQKALYKRVVMKSSPQLFFKLDKSIARGVRILNAIDSLPPPAEDLAPEGEGADAEEES